MNKVLIVSDNHGLVAELNAIKEYHHVDHMIHCGDSELSIDDPVLQGFVKVAGNCDRDARFPDEQTIQIDNLAFFITHGHLYQVKVNLLHLSYRALEKQAQVVCFGHTHILGAEKINNQLFINPGSISLSKSNVTETYAIIEWETLAKVKVHFYTIAGKRLNELSYQCSLL